MLDAIICAAVFILAGVIFEIIEFHRFRRVLRNLSDEQNNDQLKQLKKWHKKVQINFILFTVYLAIAIGFFVLYFESIKIK